MLCRSGFARRAIKFFCWLLFFYYAEHRKSTIAVPRSSTNRRVNSIQQKMSKPALAGFCGAGNFAQKLIDRSINLSSPLKTTLVRILKNRPLDF